VAFQSGSCNAVFNFCQQFYFHTATEAYDASSALAQALLASAYNTPLSTTAGYIMKGFSAGSTLAGFVTPYLSIAGPGAEVSVEVLNLATGDFAGLNGLIKGTAMDPFISVKPDMDHNGQYAVWRIEPTSPPSPVAGIPLPEPSGLWMVTTALAVLAWTTRGRRQWLSSCTPEAA
jgi:hypothetical protein